jgi:hypothetical protein
MPSLVGHTVRFADWCLTPVRYLFDGNEVTIEGGDGFSIDHKREFTEKTWVKTTAAIILLVPGVIIGASFKLLTYLIQEFRQKHDVMRKHFTPFERLDIEIPIGGSDGDLEQGLLRHKQGEYYNRTIKNLVIRGFDSTKLSRTSGLERLHVEKIILVGVKIATDRTGEDSLEQYLIKNDWNTADSSTIKEAMASTAPGKHVFLVPETE